jgi:hypothetical protein
VPASLGNHVINRHHRFGRDARIAINRLRNVGHILLSSLLPSVAAYHRGNGIDVGVQLKRRLLVLSQVRESVM